MKKILAFLISVFAVIIAIIALYGWSYRTNLAQALVTDEVISSNYIKLRKVSATERYCLFPVGDLISLWVSENLGGYRSSSSIDYDSDLYWIILKIDDDSKRYTIHLVDGYTASYIHGRVCVKDLKFRLGRQGGEKKAYAVVVETP